MIHAAAPHFLWPFAVRYAAHQLNLWPCLLAGDLAYTALDGGGWQCVGVPVGSFLPSLPLLHDPSPSLLASWKGKAVMAAMDEEIRSLIGNDTRELVERPRGVNITKNWWALMTKYHIDDTVAREKARFGVKGFT
ncbi:unnamed protein product [Closterium sp. NIES-54]